MLKVKEFLEKYGKNPTCSDIMSAIETTKTKTRTIEMKTGRIFLCENISPSPQITLGVGYISIPNVYMEGLYFKELVTINTSDISSIY